MTDRVGGNAVAVAGVELAPGPAPASARQADDAQALPEETTGERPVAALPPVHLPVLDRLIEGWPRAISDRIAGAWGARPAVAISAARNERLSAFASQFPEPALLGVVRHSQSGETGLIGLDRASVFGLVDLALGGAGRVPPKAALLRPCTLLETSLIRSALVHVLETFVACLQPAGGLPLVFDRWLADRDEVMRTREGGRALMLPLDLTLGGEATRIALALPMALIEPIRPALAATWPGAALGLDLVWREHIARELGRSRVPLTAVLHEAVMPVSRIKALVAGETLMFEAGADPVVEIRAGAVRVAEGRLGRSNGCVAVKFETIAATVEAVA